MNISTRRLFSILLFLGLFAMSLRPVADPDFWWHLRTGQLISQTGNIPQSDPFSFTQSGDPWITHEWLTELILYSLYRIGGYYLLIPLFSLIITLSFFLVFHRSPGKPFSAGFSVLLAALTSAPTWGVRPQMISLLLTASFLFILDRYWEKNNWKILIALPLLTILWVNLHAGYILGFFLIGLYLIVEIFNYMLSKYRKEKSDAKTILSLGLVYITCIAASLLNPNTYHILTYPFETLASPSMMQFIQEWFSPDFHQLEWIPLALLILALISLPSLIRRRIPLIRLLLVIIFVFAALRSMRFVPILSLVAIPFISEQLAGIAITYKSKKNFRFSKQLNSLLLFFICVVIGMYSFSVIREQPLVEQQSYPSDAVDWIQENHPKGNIFNTYDWGGYLIWRLYPDYQVYIDGRADVYGDAFIYNYIKIYSGQNGWETELENLGVEIILIEPGSALANILSASPRWSRTYEDPQSMIFIKESD